MITIGVFGAKDSIGAIYDVGQEFSEEAKLLCYPYEKKEDTPDMVKSNIQKVDVVLYSGRVPFNIVSNSMKVEKPSLYMPHNGTCIYRTLWDIKEAGLSMEYISFDTINENEIREIFKELGLSDDNIRVFEYDGDIDYEKLAQFHIDLWEKNNNYVAVTCLYKTYEILTAHGISAFRVKLTKSLIRQVIESAISKATNTMLKANQIAIVIIDIDRFKERIKGYASEYEIQRLKLKFNEKLIDFAEKIQGSIFTFGSDEYMIFTTGGVLEGAKNEVLRKNFIVSIEEDLNLSVSMGIGYGKSAYEAENNGRIGLHHAKEAGGNCAFVVDVTKRIRGPLDKAEMLDYELNSSSTDIASLCSLTGLSAKNISKIISMIEKTGTVVSSKDLAFYLNMTERSARRIMTVLIEKDLARSVGEENISSKGRPRILYELNI
ncbi:MAG: hypothetical protein K8R73_09980 [Clostridiales bacterium]|nr:hypothetical protein [Clostridiales bacterium]